MGPVLAGIGVALIVAVALTSRAFAKRRWGAEADDAYRTLGRSPATAPMVGVPKLVSFLGLVAWGLLIVGVIIWIVQ